jgi:hypothetical protein
MGQCQGVPSASGSTDVPVETTELLASLLGQYIALNRRSQSEKAAVLRLQRDIAVEIDKLPRALSGRPAKNGGARPAIPNLRDICQPFGVSPRTVWDWRFLARVPPVAFERELQRRLDTGREISTRDMLRWAQQHLAPPAVALEMEAPASAAGSVGDFFAGATTELSPGCANAIIIDPDRFGREQWEKIGHESARLLRRGGSLVAFPGNGATPDVHDALRVSLQYRIEFAHIIRGATPKVQVKRCTTHWEPILIYTTKDSGPNDWLWISSCVVESTGRDIEYHKWQKPLDTMRTLIERTTKPGDLVIDFFCGSGTTGVAAAQLDRRFIGLDNDPDAVRTTCQRIGLALPPEVFDWDEEPLTE